MARTAFPRGRPASSLRPEPTARPLTASISEPPSIRSTQEVEALQARGSVAAGTAPGGSTLRERPAVVPAARPSARSACRVRRRSVRGRRGRGRPCPRPSFGLGGSAAERNSYRSSPGKSIGRASRVSAPLTSQWMRPVPSRTRAKWFHAVGSGTVPEGCAVLRVPGSIRLLASLSETATNAGVLGSIWMVRTRSAGRSGRSAWLSSRKARCRCSCRCGRGAPERKRERPPGRDREGALLVGEVEDVAVHVRPVVGEAHRRLAAGAVGECQPDPGADRPAGHRLGHLPVGGRVEWQVELKPGDGPRPGRLRCRRRVFRFRGGRRDWRIDLRRVHFGRVLNRRGGDRWLLRDLWLFPRSRTVDGEVGSRAEAQADQPRPEQHRERQEPPRAGCRSSKVRPCRRERKQVWRRFTSRRPAAVECCARSRGRVGRDPRRRDRGRTDALQAEHAGRIAISGPLVRILRA